MKADTKHHFFFQSIAVLGLALLTSCANDLGGNQQSAPLAAVRSQAQECPNGSMSVDLERVSAQGELSVSCDAQIQTVQSRSESSGFIDVGSDPIQPICTPWAKIDSSGDVAFVCKEDAQVDSWSTNSPSMLSSIAPLCSKVRGISSSCETIPVMDGEILARTLCLNGVDPALQVPPGVSSVRVRTFPSLGGSIVAANGQASILTQLNVPGVASSYNVMITLDGVVNTSSNRSLVLGAGFKSQLKDNPKFSRFLGNYGSATDIRYYSARRLGSSSEGLAQGGPVVFEWHYNSSSLGAALNEHNLSEEQFISALSSSQYRHYVLEKLVEEFDDGVLPTSQAEVLSYNLELNSQTLAKSVNNAYQEFDGSEAGVKAALGHSKDLAVQGIANFATLYELQSTSEAFVHMASASNISFGMQSLLVMETASGQHKEIILAYLRYDNGGQSASESFYYSSSPMMSIEPNCAPKVKVWKHLEGETAYFDGNPAHRTYWLGNLRDCTTNGEEIPAGNYYQGVADVHGTMKQIANASHYGLKCENEVGTVCVAQNGQGLGRAGSRGYSWTRAGGTYHKWECVEVER